MKVIVNTLEKMEDITLKLEQHRAALALINSVEEGIVAKEEIQGVYRQVGCCIRDIFDANRVYMAIFDQDFNISFPYVHGETAQSRAFSSDITEKILSTRKPVLIRQEMEGSITSVGTGKKNSGKESYVAVPILVEKEPKGVICIYSKKEKNPYTEHEQELLSSIAIHVGMAVFHNEAEKKLEEALNDVKAFRKQLIQQEKLASLGKLMAGIAHETKNPLNFVNNFSELNVELIEEVFEELEALGKNETVDEISAILQDVKENLLKIKEHGNRADRIVKSMLKHSRGGSSKMEPTDLNLLIKEYVNLSFHGMRAGKNPVNVGIDLELDEQVGLVPLMEEDFSRVILNLCSNAFDAMREKLLKEEGKDEYTPRLSIRTSRKNQQVSVEVRDNGPGIPEKHKEKVLQPFFTTKKGTEGTGLGLSIINDIVKAHKGTLEVSTRENSFTQFTILLPNDLK